jgi:hypothetical protein
MSTAAMASVVTPPPASRRCHHIRSQAATGATGPPSANRLQSASTMAWIACAPAWTAQLNPCPLPPSLLRTVVAIRYWLVTSGPHGRGMGSRKVLLVTPVMCAPATDSHSPAASLGVGKGSLLPMRRIGVNPVFISRPGRGAGRRR